jgi:hypothetical protein
VDRGEKIEDGGRAEEAGVRSEAKNDITTPFQMRWGEPQVMVPRRLYTFWIGICLGRMGIFLYFCNCLGVRGLGRVWLR